MNRRIGNEDVGFLTMEVVCTIDNLVDGLMESLVGYTDEQLDELRKVINAGCVLAIDRFADVIFAEYMPPEQAP